VNKRFVRHALFWLAYTLQGALLEYAWIHSFYEKWPQVAVIWLAIKFSLALMPAKMLFTYLVLNVFIKQALVKYGSLKKVIAQLVLALLAAIFLHRLVGNYYITATLYPTYHVIFSEVYEPGKVLLSLLDTGYVVGIAVALRLFRLQINHLRSEKDLVRDKLETELKFLKNQINPHFLFNTLNNIYSLARKKSDKTPEIVMRLSKLLRFMLYESGRETIPIADEIRILEDYVQLEKIRYNERLQLSFEQHIDDLNQLITPLILLPFVENAFKHGVSETTDDTRIDIRIALQNGQLSFSVNNSHNGQNGSELHEKIGLANVRRQLELMYSDFALDIDNQTNSFNVALQINLNRHATI
jgi:two-component system LytT family sensor kinase